MKHQLANEVNSSASNPMETIDWTYCCICGRNDADLRYADKSFDSLTAHFVEIGRTMSRG